MADDHNAPGPFASEEECDAYKAAELRESHGYIPPMADDHTANCNDPFGLLTDEEWQQLHADLAEIARLRRAAEAAARNIVIGGTDG